MTLSPIATSKRIRRALLLKTGQTTSYGSGTGVDDGALELGVAKSYTVLTAGQYSGTTNITINSKTDAHGNACVIDNNTGLMWSRTVSGSVGPASNGLLPWTTTGSGSTAEGIFPYVAAANAAALAGYTDWRIPNVFEYMSLADEEAPSGFPDSTAFPAAISLLWSSTTRVDNTANGLQMSYSNGYPISGVKPSTAQVRLVRGPV